MYSSRRTDNMIGESPFIGEAAEQRPALIISVKQLDRYKLTVARRPAVDLAQHRAQRLAWPALVHHRRPVIWTDLGQEQMYGIELRWPLQMKRFTLKRLFTAVSQRTACTSCFVKFF